MRQIASRAAAYLGRLVVSSPIEVLASLVVVAAVGTSLYAHLVSHDFEAGRSFATFKEHVAPVLAGTCSARDEEGRFVCHGQPPGGLADLPSLAMGSEASPGLSASVGADYTPQIPHMIPTRGASCTTSCHSKRGNMRFSFPLDANGRLESDRQLLLAFEKTRPLARFDGPAKFARLLRMPLGSQAGGFGLLHGGGEVFERADEPEFAALASWVDLENAEGSGKQASPVGEAERFFGQKVLPILARNTCLAPSCHIFNHSAFVPDPGMPIDDLSTPLEERFTPEQVSFNRMTSKGLIQSLVYLTGDVEQSRFLRKIIPIDKGGVLHRGGNDQFLDGPEDPDYVAIAKWLRLERAESLADVKIGGRTVAADEVGAVRGVVFVRTRTDNRRRYLDVGRFLPGADLFLLKIGPGETLETAAGPAINLTAGFRRGVEADIREPDVRYDGRSVVFAMRLGAKDNLNIYEIELGENLDPVPGSFRRLTHGPSAVNGMKVHFTDPTYVPSSEDDRAAAGGLNLDRVDVVYASNLAGEIVQSVERGIVGEADGGTRSAIVDFDRPEVDGTFVGRRLFVVSGTNEGEWRRIAGFENRLFTTEGRSYIRVDRPFPAPVDNSTVYVIEREASTQPGFLPSYSVWGSKYPDRGRERETYEATISRITWTSGQELDLSVRTTGEVFYSGQRSGVDKDGRPVFHMASCRRHLDTRFSFPTHHGNRSQVLVYADNHELPTGIDIHVGTDPDNLWEAGNLSTSDHQFGPGLEARNPHDAATGTFEEAGVQEAGVPPAAGRDITNTRFAFTGAAPSHPRFVFKKSSLFPLRGPSAITRTGLSPGGAYRDPYPLPDGGLLVSFAPGPIDHLDPNANPDFDIFVMHGDPGFQPRGGKGLPRVERVRLPGASVGGMSDIQAVPVYARLKPKINAGRRPKREHLIHHPGAEPDHRPARYLERNFLLIDAILRDPSPVGKAVAYKRDPTTGQPLDSIDEVVAVRMVEVLPMSPDLAGPLDLSAVRNGDPESTRVANGIHPLKRIVGEAPLLPDGSIYLEVPSKTPLIIQSLNPDGMALRQEARYYAFAPNEPFTISPSRSETFQTCGACMGSITGRPEDLFGPVNAFTGRGQVDALANGGAPRPMGLAVADRASIDFERDIQPLFDAHCTQCHGGAAPDAGLSLTSRRTRYYNDAYESLMQLEDPHSGWYGRKRYISERDGLAIESYLTEKIYGKELKARRPLTGDIPHPSRALFAARGMAPAPLDDGQRRRLVRWMDLGAPFRGPDGAPAGELACDTSNTEAGR